MNGSLENKGGEVFLMFSQNGSHRVGVAPLHFLFLFFSSHITGKYDVDG